RDSSRDNAVVSRLAQCRPSQATLPFRLRPLGGRGRPKPFNPSRTQSTLGRARRLAARVVGYRGSGPEQFAAAQKPRNASYWHRLSVRALRIAAVVVALASPTRIPLLTFDRFGRPNVNVTVPAIFPLAITVGLPLQ